MRGVDLIKRAVTVETILDPLSDVSKRIEESKPVGAPSAHGLCSPVHPVAAPQHERIVSLAVVARIHGALGRLAPEEPSLGAGPGGPLPLGISRQADEP